MIQILATKYSRLIAGIFTLIFYSGMVTPLFARNPEPRIVTAADRFAGNYTQVRPSGQRFDFTKKNVKKIQHPLPAVRKEEKTDIDGPGQPEMSSFKSAGTSDMVNLFTGDFSYNIPLLDVGGYPVNIFYNGGIGMEQEASWVGLGWNINPGTITRNMRGVPDDFDGGEKQTVEQNMKKNVTWGVNLGADLELVGIKDLKAFQGSVGANFGFSINNYLGPSIEMGIKGTTSFSVGAKGLTEKGPVGVTAGISATVNSRSGMTITPNLSLAAKSYMQTVVISNGIGLSTSYNSRTGIRALQLHDQTSMSYGMVKDRKDESKSVNSGSMGNSTWSSTISFLKPSYSPMIRPTITNRSGAGRFQLGGAMFGIYGSAEVEGYGQISSIGEADQHKSKPMIGYMYAQKAMNNQNAIMDFSRVNDQEVTPNTTIISVPQYTYDVFSVQGEGTGGTIRLYRNDNGYVHDNITVSKDDSWSAGVDVGIPGHVGVNFNTIKTPSRISEWDAGNKLRTTLGFEQPSGLHEKVYFRNPGENCVINPGQYTNIGGTSLVRFKLGGSGLFPTVEPKLEVFDHSGVKTDEITTRISNTDLPRTKRTQLISFLTAAEATEVGLDKSINVSNPDVESYLDEDNKLSRYNNEGLGIEDGKMPRVDGVFRRANHISQINITENDGKRYVYGVPVYNISQKDLMFTVGNSCTDCEQIAVDNSETSVDGSPHMGGEIGGKDGYVQTTEIPAYAQSFLLSGLLSPDYVDVTGNGITEDDQGTAVKYNYSFLGYHYWRTPMVKPALEEGQVYANSNPGNLSEKKDDKGIISYGKRESWYLHSIESKSMIAFFRLRANRHDGKGADEEFKKINYEDQSIANLDRIDLYNKADLRKNGLANAKPIKTVHFGYEYNLCKGTPDNEDDNEGKLTLKRIWFSYNGQTRSNETQYVFSYTPDGNETEQQNPHYLPGSSDRWGNYKPQDANPDAMMNREYPYSTSDKEDADSYVNAWNLKRILLPSGGQIEVDYEADDYAFVQNKRAATMAPIIGFSNAVDGAISDKMYTISSPGVVNKNDFMFIRVPQACANGDEVYKRYLQGVDQLLVRMKVIMPNPDQVAEQMTAYTAIADWGTYDDPENPGQPAIWVQMKPVIDKDKEYSPLAMTAVEYLRERLPGQAFGAYDLTEETTLNQLSSLFEGLIEEIGSAFTDLAYNLMADGKAQRIIPSQSFVRLDDADGFKYGGGHRVKEIRLKDNWDRMTGQYSSVYGQHYDYTTTEVFNGAEREISSGVASYEPSIGGEENPFQSIIQVANKVPLGPTSYGAIEMPVMDALFPAPLVGYSKVTVSSIGKKQNTNPEKKTKSGIGRQVTEFYTAKDYPVIYDYTTLDATSDLQEHENPTLNFFFKHAFDSRAISQGFLVAVNDMHGKLKSQASYAENDPSLRVNYTENFYRNTGVNGLDEAFDFAHNENGGQIVAGNMGVDIELMTDTREFSLQTHSFDLGAQVDWMLPAPLPLWLPFIWPTTAESENVYRAVTTTKLINYHAVLDHVKVVDKGSEVSTSNMVWDAETGQVIVSKTNNEFDKPVFSLNYPAYWAYSGMGPAYQNTDAVFSLVTFIDGKITIGDVPPEALESGDELYVTVAGGPSDCDPEMSSSESIKKIWAFNKHKSNSSLTDIEPDYIFLDETGKPYSRSGVSFRIIRSGKRNMLSAAVAGFTMMTDPVDGDTHKLTFTETSKVVNTSALEFREKWQVDNDVFYKYNVVTDPETCTMNEVIDCDGYLEKKINPYVKGLLGTFRPFKNLVFYGNRSLDDYIMKNGFLVDYSPYWNFNEQFNLIPSTEDPHWVWNNQSTRYNSKGMEVETTNALGIYTAAQYGYNKTIPVAMANNSRASEMFFEGFEDYTYDDLLNAGQYNPCANRHIDFNGLANSEIFSPVETVLNTHTGKYMMQLAPDTYVSKSFPVSGYADENFDLEFGSKTGHTLSDLSDGNDLEMLEDHPGLPANDFYGHPVTYNTSGTGSTSVTLHVENRTSSGPSVLYGYYFKTGSYISIPEDNVYTFITHATTHDVQTTDHDLRMDVSLQSVSSGDFIAPQSRTDDLNSLTEVQATSVYCLKKGIYRLTTDCIHKYRPTLSGSVWSEPSDVFTLSTGGNAPINYKTLSEDNTCTFSTPIPASESMLHPTFTIPAGKKMLLSGWIKTNCIPGGETDCDNLATLQLNFSNGGGTDPVHPTGPTIEGWRRCELVFTVPEGNDEAELRFNNNSGDSPVYVDDIRIQPYNANMKTYVYDPVNLRLKAELDANNYATFYEYDEEGTLIRTKVETKEGIKTISETRNAKQKNIIGFNDVL